MTSQPQMVISRQERGRDHCVCVHIHWLVFFRQELWIFSVMKAASPAVDSFLVPFTWGAANMGWVTDLQVLTIIFELFDFFFSFTCDVPFVVFMYLVFTCMPGGVTVGDSGLWCCVPVSASAKRGGITPQLFATWGRMLEHTVAACLI